MDSSATGDCSVSRADSSGIAARAMPAISPASDCILVVDQPVHGMENLRQHPARVFAQSSTQPWRQAQRGTAFILPALSHFVHQPLSLPLRLPGRSGAENAVSERKTPVFCVSNETYCPKGDNKPIITISIIAQSFPSVNVRPKNPSKIYNSETGLLPLFHPNRLCAICEVQQKNNPAQYLAQPRSPML